MGRIGPLNVDDSDSGWSYRLEDNSFREEDRIDRDWNALALKRQANLNRKCPNGQGKACSNWKESDRVRYAEYSREGGFAAARWKTGTEALTFLTNLWKGEMPALLNAVKDGGIVRQQVLLQGTLHQDRILHVSSRDCLCYVRCGLGYFDSDAELPDDERYRIGNDYPRRPKFGDANVDHTGRPQWDAKGNGWTESKTDWTSEFRPTFSGHVEEIYGTSVSTSVGDLIWKSE